MRSLTLVPSLLIVAMSCGSNGTSSGNDAGLPDAGSPDAQGDAGSQLCTGTLCGIPAACCVAGNECVEGACLTACESGVRCGASLDVCCSAGDVCLSELCTAPGLACVDSYDCQPGEFCEPTIDQCLPQPDPLLCEIQPVFGALDVTEEASFDRSNAEDLNEEIISIPVVADLDGDGAPEVVVNMARQDGGSWPSGRIVVLDGRDVSIIKSGPFEHDPDNDSYGVHGRSTIALADVNGDLLPDIIFAARPTGGPTGSGLGGSVGPIVAIDAQGNLLWTSHTAAGVMTGYNAENAAVTAANLDSDPQAEIVVGGLVLDHDGTVLGSVGLGVREGTNSGYRGGISLVADLDDDGAPEIITGRSAWKIDVTQGAPASATITNYWTHAGEDGYAAIADFDGNGSPEVALVAGGAVSVLNGQTGELFCARATCATPGERSQPIALPGGTSNNRGGPPTISDFDADGRPEIGVAGGFAYVVIDVNRPSESLEAFGNPVPAAVGTGELFFRWTYATQDASSNSTGSSVFDFQGDGAAEVVYADECYMRVFSGQDGTVQLELPSTSATIHEYPLVVDVDADGNSEILIVAQAENAASNCGEENPPIAPRQGLYVYGDANDEWVPTRRVWPQHTYHVTNALSDGNIPTDELDNWVQPGLNNYRQNVQGDGVFNAADLAIDLSIGLGSCESGLVVLQARVTNPGALGVAPGALVEFFEGTDASGTALGSATTSIALLPGQSTTVTLSIPAPQVKKDYFTRVDGTGAIEECDESNNTAATTGVDCNIIR